MRETPPTQKCIARRKRISPRTVGLIIHENLHLPKRHKAHGHHLKEKHIEERFTNVRKLYDQHFIGDRWQWAVKFDEAWMYLNDTKSIEPYVKKNKEKRDAVTS
ncbi:hypothetical protein C0J52_21197 [Blattella germanica]|nr:hypothetical protein C0J52_21197 [Blattella germanica]